MLFNNNNKINRTDFIFHENFIRGGDCPVKETESGRFYYPFGLDKTGFPSVTTVLGKTQSKEKQKSLEEWRANFPNADEFTAKAARRGTILHEQAELFLMNEFDKLKIRNKHLNQVVPVLNERVNNIRCIEAPLFSTQQKIAGRVDLIADFDEILSVIDFKTSSRLKDEEEIEDYYIQETAYAMMYEERYGELPKYLVTIMAFDNYMYPYDLGKKAQVFIKQTEDYIPKVIQRIQEFYKKICIQ